MKAVATRYSGTFTPAGGSAPLPRVRHFEIWNEPNLKGFFRFNGRSNLGKYKGLVKAAYTNIKAANKKTIVIGGVGGPRSSNGQGNVSAKVWLNGLVNDKSVKFDAYSQHIYPSQGPLFTSKSYAKAFPTWASLDQILATLDRKKKGMKLYITEAGYTTATTPFRNVQRHAGQAGALPEADLQPEDRQERPCRRGGLVQPAGQRQLAGRPAERRRRQEAEPRGRFRTIASRPIAPALRAELSR